MADVKHTPEEVSAALLEALESAPIIGPFESGQDFKKRQDVWLREVYQPAIALARGEKVDG